MALDSDLIAEWTDAVQDGYTLYRKQIDNYPGEGSCRVTPLGRLPSLAW